MSFQPTAPILKEMPVYGASRLGMARLAEDDYSISKYEYELSDHLGNVRATFSDDESNTGKAKLVNYTDYYPFGWEVPNRILADNSYRFAYQGQFAEKDQETGFTQFEARLFDSRIGRWMSPDPARQFASPYLGMRNNPVSGIDPNGAVCIFESGFIVSHQVNYLRGNTHLKYPVPLDRYYLNDNYNYWSGDEMVISQEILILNLVIGTICLYQVDIHPHQQQQKDLQEGINMVHLLVVN